MAYQDIPAGTTPGAGAGSGEVLSGATDSTGNFLGAELTTTVADITLAVTGGAGTDQKTNLSLPNVGPGAVTTLRPKAVTTDHAGRVTAITSWTEAEVPATWTGVRFYLLDYDGGNDANVGYVDSTAGATIAPAGLALKTWEQFFQIFPKVGNGRRVVILWKPRAAGATYLKQDGVTEDVIDFTGVAGYAYRLTRGSTDLTNSATDRVLCGFITALAGPNGDGSFTCAGGATTSLFSVSAGTLTAEPAILGWRVRFSGNVTAGIANICTNISANTASAVTPGEVLGTAPANGDTFFVEMPGCRVGQYLATDNASAESTGDTSMTPLANPAGAYDVAAAVTSTTNNGFRVSGSGYHCITGIEQIDITLALATSTQFQITDCVRAAVVKSYTDEAGTARLVGFGGRVRNGWLIARNGQLELQGFAWINNAGAIGAIDARLLSIGQIGFRGCFSAGSYVGSRLRIQQVGAAGGTSGGLFAGSLGFIGSTTATIPSRSINSLAFNQSWPRLLNWSITNCAQNAIQINNTTGIAGGVMLMDGLVGSASNLAFGIDVSGCVGVRFILGRLVANTVTGTSGDIQTGGTAAIIAHTGLTLTNVIDSAGNEYLGTGGNLVGACIPVINSSGGALAVGEIVRKNATTTQVVTAQGDTAANAVFAGIMVTAPASTAVGYMAVSGAPYTLFDGAPTLGALAYLSPGTARKATTTIPALAATNQKLRLGRPLTASGSTGRLLLQPELISVLADGLL